jgi:O-antigen/teichoic acid export membrane protein
MFVNKEFKQNVQTLFTGSIFAQIINLGLIVVLGRIFPTDVIGTYFIYSALLMIASTVTSGQSHLSIYGTKNTEEAQSNFNYSVLTSIISNSVLYFPLFVIWAYEIELPFANISAEWLLIIPLAAILNNANQAYENLFTVLKAYKIIRNSRVIKAVSLFAIQGTIGLMYNNSILFLIIGLFVSQLITVLYLWSHHRKISLFATSRHTYFAFVKTFKHILVYNSAIAVINILSTQLPIILIGYYYSATEVASFGMALKIVSIPFGLMGGNVGQVFFQQASESFIHGNRMLPLLTRTIKYSLLVGLIPLILVFTIGPWGIVTFLGDKWNEAATLIQYLLIWMFIGFTTSSIDSITTVFKIQKYIAIYQLFLFIFRILAISVGAWLSFRFTNTVLLYVVVGMAFNLFYQITLVYITYIKDKPLQKMHA